MADETTLYEDIDAPSAPLTPGWMPRRYALLGRIGAGGAGEVFRVHDRELDRPVALKVLHADASNAAMDRFVAEARRTAGLQHPAVVPIHDLGRLPDGRPWFTMREVVGTTFAEAIRALHAGSTPTRWGGSRFPFRRLVAALEIAARAAGFAHARGVLHRDLTPSNLILGDAGEAVVLDWGVAALVGSVPGGVVGTVPWLSPEQARGDVTLGPAADVYTLGAVLHALLVGEPPFRSGTPLAVVRAGDPIPRAARPPAGPTPEELGLLCDAALARDPDARPPDGRAFADRLRAWLDGEHRRDQADALVASLTAEPAALVAERAAVAGLRDAARARLAALLPSAPASTKAPAWALEEDANLREEALAAREARYAEALRSALLLDADHPGARDALADLAASQLVAADRAGDARAVARHAVDLTAWDRGRYAALLRGDGELTLETDPPGAQVRLERYETHHGVLVPVPVGALGLTPLRGVPLGPGSWRLVIEAPGHAPVVYPVAMRRGGAWTGVAPGASSPEPIPLPRLGELREDERYVPAGWFACGGDPEAPDPDLPGDVWVPGFVMRRDPVTFAEYFAFLNAIDANDPALAARYAPAGDEAAARPGSRRGPDGRLAPVQILPGAAPSPDAPVVFVSWEGAAAYAAWCSVPGEPPWRLPHDLEWEKAARGVDGRPFPWGHRFDPSLARMSASTAGAPGLAPIGEPATDVSAYGVRGLAGNVRDWCANAWRPAQSEPTIVRSTPTDLAQVRGGAWFAGPAYCRVAGRFACAPDRRNGALGFRLARAFTPTGASTAR